LAADAAASATPGLLEGVVTREFDDRVGHLVGSGAATRSGAVIGASWAPDSLGRDPVVASRKPRPLDAFVLFGDSHG
jgi:hypothetical protein